MALNDASAVLPWRVTDAHGHEDRRRVEVAVRGGQLRADIRQVPVGQLGRIGVVALLPVNEELLHHGLGRGLGVEVGREPDPDQPAEHDERHRHAHQPPLGPRAPRAAGAAAPAGRGPATPRASPRRTRRNRRSTDGAAHLDLTR